MSHSHLVTLDVAFSYLFIHLLHMKTTQITVNSDFLFFFVRLINILTYLLKCITMHYTHYHVFW